MASPPQAGAEYISTPEQGCTGRTCGSNTPMQRRGSHTVLTSAGGSLPRQACDTTWHAVPCTGAFGRAKQPATGRPWRWLRPHQVMVLSRGASRHKGARCLLREALVQVAGLHSWIGAGTGGWVAAVGFALQGRAEKTGETGEPGQGSTGQGVQQAGAGVRQGPSAKSGSAGDLARTSQ